MEKPMEHYGNLRLSAVRQALEKNNYDAFVAEDRAAAKALVLDTIMPGLPVKTISWGGSATIVQSGLYEALKNDGRKVLSPRAYQDCADQRRSGVLAVFCHFAGALRTRHCTPCAGIKAPF
jgi:hypothetical protein